MRYIVNGFRSNFFLGICGKQNLFFEFHSGCAEHTAEFSRKSFLRSHRVEHFSPRVRIYPEHIIARQRFDRTVTRLGRFRDERAEKSVPENENSGVIFVEIMIVRAVMNAMMRRRVENIFDRRRQFFDFLRVNPELVDQIQSVHRRECPERKTEKSERQIKNPVRDARKPALSNGDRQIILIRRMMNDVKIPEKPHFVADAMKPVIKKIVRKKQNRPRPNARHRNLEQRDILIDELVKKDLNDRKNKTERDAAETERDICPNILSVVFFLMTHREKRLDGDQQSENRNGNNSRF